MKIEKDLFTDLVRKIVYYTQGGSVSIDSFSEGINDNNISEFAKVVSEDIFHNNRRSFKSIDEVRDQVNRIIANFTSSEN